MNAKVKAMFEEFPFLGKYANIDYCSYVAVKRIDEDLLETCFEANSEDYFSTVLLLDSNGECLTQVGGRPNSSKFHWLNPFSWKRIVPFFETVEEALLRIGEISDKVYCILAIQDCTYEIVVYKPPKNFTLKAWLERRLELAKHEVKKDLLEIDKELDTLATT